MEIVAWAGIFIGVVLYLAWPIVRPAGARLARRQHGIELLARKEETYADLADLELDYRMAKISEADYRELKEKYRLEALSLLGRIDAKDDLGELLEREVKARRRRERTCPACGAGADRVERSCLKCGASLAAVFLLLLLPALAGAAVLEGRLSNKTPNGAKVRDVEVTLATSNDGQERTRSARTDAKGRFRFADLSPGERYRVNFRYQGADYEAAADFDKSRENFQIEVPVYDSTGDPSSLRVKAHFLLVNPGSGSLRVQELLQVENTGDKAYIGSRPLDAERRATLQLTLPQGAAELRYGSGLMEHCVVAAPKGLLDTMDVKPGVREIGFSYALQASSDQTAFLRRLDYATDSLSVFVGGGASGRSPVLKEVDFIDTPNGRYQHLTQKNLAAGSPVSVDFSSPPVPPVSYRSLVFAAIALTLAAALAYVLAGRRRRPARAASSDAMPQAKYSDLVEAMARLDDAFEAGEIRPEEYERVRARKKAELLALAGQQK